MTDSTNVFALKVWHFAPPRRAQTVPQCPLPLNHVKYITSNVRDFFFMLLFKRASLFAVKQRRKQREKQKLWCGKSNMLWKRPFSFHHFCSKEKKKFSVVFIFVFNVKRDTAVNTPMCTWQKRPISLGEKAEGSFTIAVFNYKPPHGGKTGRKKNK